MKILSDSTLTQTDYSKILDEYGIQYRYYDYQLEIDSPKAEMGWILHISVIITQIPELLMQVLPDLISIKCPFRLCANERVAKKIQNGDAGIDLIGKVLTIYPNNINQAVTLSKILIEKTKPFRGPKVLTDHWLGGNVYTRYGAFNPTYTYNENGERIRAVKSNDGKISTDKYVIPFKKPDNIIWPFNEIIELNENEYEETKIEDYNVLQIISSSPKGNVYLAISSKNPSEVNILKQGKRNMWIDEYGRDMTNRLEWQSEVHKKLSNLVDLPTLRNFFYFNGDAYLELELIKGISIREAIQKINPSEIAFFSLSKNQQKLLISLSYQILEIIHVFHENGFLHRDLSPSNFIVEENWRVRPIDIEMSYSLLHKNPSPPFEFGTAGYTVPLNERKFDPEISEDLFGAGALLIFILTGIEPTSLDRNNLLQCEEVIYQVISSKSIPKLLSRSISKNPSERTSILELMNALDNLAIDIDANETGLHIDYKYETPPSDKIIDHFINGLINTLSTKTIAQIDNLWVSFENGRPSEQHIPYYSHQFDNGIPGIIYALSCAKSDGFDIGCCNPQIQKGLIFLKEHFLSFSPKIPLGLSNGAAGVWLSIIKALSKGLIPFDLRFQEQFKAILKIETKSVTISNGLSGIGIALLNTEKYWDVQFLNSMLENICRRLFEEQITSGTWITMRINGGCSRYSSSFLQGNTGPIYFLLCLYQLKPTPELKEKICTCIDLLNKETEINITEFLSMKISVYSQLTWHLDGINGSTLVYLKAFELFKNIEYLQYGEKLLNLRHKYELPKLIGLEKSLPVTAMLYLEAYRVTRNAIWITRCNWLFHYLVGLSHGDQNRYWVNEDKTSITADLKYGLSTILLFLLKYRTSLQIYKSCMTVI